MDDEAKLKELADISQWSELPYVIHSLINEDKIQQAWEHDLLDAPEEDILERALKLIDEIPDDWLFGALRVKTFAYQVRQLLSGGYVGYIVGREGEAYLTRPYLEKDDAEAALADVIVDKFDADIRHNDTEPPSPQEVIASFNHIPSIQTGVQRVLCPD
ncbi:MAG: hypothetical protein ABEN55_21060 [Bradymonadaceae bacterium]